MALIKRIAALMLAACLLALSGCLSKPAAQPGNYEPGGGPQAPQPAQSSLYLNGAAYEANLSINGLPFKGTLARADAAAGWRFQLSGSQVEKTELVGAEAARTWDISFDLSKKGLTADPTGIYKGRASISLAYDMAQFDKEAFSLVMWERGDGLDFNHQKIKGWLSHDEYETSVLTQLWRSEDFTLYIGPLQQGAPSYASTLGHTLSYMPDKPELSLSHRLYYDLPGEAEAYIYSLEGSEREQAAILSLKQYNGKKAKELPLDPVARFDLSGALNALNESYILLELTQK